MKTFSLDMPQISDCEVTQCVYNLKNTCHARAITIGDGVNALCDTFFNSSPHNKRKDIAGVGACKVSRCSFNTDYECLADSISVGIIDNHAKCATFSPT